MDRFLGLSSTEWTGIYTIATLCLLLVAVMAALYAKRQWRTSREQVTDARRATVEASRPYVLATIEPSKASPQLFDLVVRNIGQRPALNVTITLTPPPVRAKETSSHKMADAKMLNEPVAMIAPGQEMRAFYDSHIERRGRDDLPISHQVLLKYRDTSQREYLEESVLDIEALKGTLFTSVKTIHDIAKILEKIHGRLDAASLLERSGSLTVEASIESKGEKQRRLDEEEAEQEESWRQTVEQSRGESVTEVSTSTNGEGALAGEGVETSETFGN